MVKSDTRENSPLQEKIRVLMKKKDLAEKELKDLEDAKKKEAEEIKEEIAKTVRELRDEEEKKYLEEQEKRVQVQEDLEKTVGLESSSDKILEDNYGSYSSIGKIDVYEVASHNQYEKVKEIIGKSENFWSPTERNFMKEVTYNVDKIRREEMYLDKKDPNNYILRLASLIKRTQT